MVPSSAVKKPSITIDYFPPEIYHEYEKDQRYLDPSITRESSNISSQVQILVTDPYKTHEQDVLGNNIKGSFATFEPPPQKNGISFFFRPTTRDFYP